MTKADEPLYNENAGCKSQAEHCVNSFMEGMIDVSLVELEQTGLELKGLEKDIRELGDSL